jgi:predicted amidohydrolase YtcJ
MAEAIKYYALGSAYASFEEDIKGSLEVGKLADMVVLSQDLLKSNPKNIPMTKVLYTIVGGKIVYDRSSE